MGGGGGGGCLRIEKPILGHGSGPVNKAIENH